MQSVAAEMNHAETAFVHFDGEKHHLRWFTPTVEVDLCGHATLAAAHILWQADLHSKWQPIRFHTRSGTLTARLEDGQIALDFPSEPAVEAVAPAELPGMVVKWFGKNRMDYIAELPDEAAVRSLVPDMDGIRNLRMRGLIVTARASTEGVDFVSRFFAPSVGVPEDPVTGSAHCCLAPFWTKRLGKQEMLGYQASPRGGFVRVRVKGDRVELVGSAVTVLEGSLSF